MSDYLKKAIVVVCSAWVVFFAAPGPRQVYDWVFGSSIHHPSYLFANSEKEACRRLRRVVDNGKVNLYVENLTTHKQHIFFTQPQIRQLVVACAWKFY